MTEKLEDLCKAIVDYSTWFAPQDGDVRVLVALARKHDAVGGAYYETMCAEDLWPGAEIIVALRLLKNAQKHYGGNVAQKLVPIIAAIEDVLRADRRPERAN